jgi:hypothetical protein
MSRITARVTRALACVALAAVTVGVGPVASPAAADTPTVTVSPAAVADGQTVAVTAAGFPAGLHAFVQCPGSYAGSPDTFVLGTCRLLSDLSSGVPAPSIEATALSVFTTADGSRTVDCAVEAGGCIMGIKLFPDAGGSLTQAWAPVGLLPRLDIQPNRGLSDGDVATVAATGVPAGSWSIAQCPIDAIDQSTPSDPGTPATTVVPTPPTTEVPAPPTTVVPTPPTTEVPAPPTTVIPTPPTTEIPAPPTTVIPAPPTTEVPDVHGGACGPATGVTVVDGTLSVEVEAHDPLVTGDGTEVPCGYYGCAYVLSSAHDPYRAAGLVSFGPPSMTVDPPGELRDSQQVEVTVAGLTGTRVSIDLCALPIGPERCTSLFARPLDPLGSAVLRPTVPARLVPGVGTPLDCRVEDCVLAAVVDGVVELTAPVTFAPAITITATPTNGLLEGQVIDVEVTGLVPGSSHPLFRCAGWCVELGTFIAAPDGTISTGLPASQILDQTVYCRANCAIGVVADNGDVLRAPYAMATGSLTVAPDGGLQDGESVQVTGTDLMPTYAGQAIGPFPSGGWALTQCDAAVLDGRPSLYGAFDNCALPPTTQPVDIEGSTFDSPFAAQATFTTILGRTVDCTAAPGTCVVGLVRLEQNASVTTHLAPITFETP